MQAPFKNAMDYWYWLGDRHAEFVLCGDVDKAGGLTSPQFRIYLRSEFGIDIRSTSEGTIYREFDVVDEEKWLWFCLVE